MKSVTNSVFSVPFTGSSNYFIESTGNQTNNGFGNVFSVAPLDNEIIKDKAKYSVFEVAYWFLKKESQTQKKLQKLCYYAQAWCYALNGYRLMDTDFEAWIHGPVSPVLYDRFKSFGSHPFRLAMDYESSLDEEDVSLLESIWDTYGGYTGNALEALSHSEEPWKQARRGYAPNERCSVIISPESMREYYRSIYIGE